MSRVSVPNAEHGLETAPEHRLLDLESEKARSEVRELEIDLGAALEARLDELPCAGRGRGYSRLRGVNHSFRQGSGATPSATTSGL